MCHEKQIHFAKQIIRTSDFKFLFLSEIAKIEKAELPVGNQNAHRTGILSVSSELRRFRFAVGIRLSGSRQRGW